MPRIITAYDYDWKKNTRPEYNSGKSITIPDQNYTLREILNKFTTGQSISGMGSYNEFDGEYDGDGKEWVDFDQETRHPKQMDLVDRKAYEYHARQELKKMADEKAEKAKTTQSVPSIGGTANGEPAK